LMPPSRCARIPASLCVLLGFCMLTPPHALPAAHRVRQNMFKLREGRSAETSGGLLLTIPADAAEAFIADLRATEGADAWVVGRVIPGANDARILPTAEVLEV
jgi:hypothetical protein